MMSLDKFGRFRENGDERVLARGPPGEGFKLTQDGDYDIGNKKLVNVGVPTADNDVITKIYLDSHTPNHLSESFSMRGKRIQDVADPTLEGDAVNLKHVRQKCVLYGEDGTIRAKNGRISGVKDPIKEKDVANKRYVDNATPTRDSDYWGFGKKRLARVANPIDDSDAVTKNYLGKNCPVKGESVWEFENKRLKGVGDALEPDEAVTLRYCRELENQLRRDINVVSSVKVKSVSEHVVGLIGEINAIKSNVNENRRDAEMQLRKFARLLFPHVQGSIRGSAEGSPATADNYLNWNEILDNSLGDSTLSRYR